MVTTTFPANSTPSTQHNYQLPPPTGPYAVYGWKIQRVDVRVKADTGVSTVGVVAISLRPDGKEVGSALGSLYPYGGVTASGTFYPAAEVSGHSIRLYVKGGSGNILWSEVTVAYTELGAGATVLHGISVWDTATFTDVAAAHVLLESTQYGTFEGDTDLKGKLQFELPIMSTFTGTVTKSGYETKVQAVGVGSVAGATLIGITPVTAAPPIAPPVVPGVVLPILTVHVTKPGGDFNGALVEVVTVGSKFTGFGGLTDFTLSAGTYTVKVYGAGHTTQTRSVAVTASRTETFDMVAVAPTVTKYSLTLTVKDRDTQTAISGARVYLGTAIANIGMGYTDSAGSVTFTTVPAGTQVVTVEKVPYPVAMISVDMTANKTETVLLGMLVSTAMMTLLQENGFMAQDIPYGADDVIIIEFESSIEPAALDGHNVEEWGVQLAAKVNETHPEVIVVGIKGRGSMVAVFVRASPLAPIVGAVIIAGIMAIAAFFAIALPAIMGYKTVEKKAEVAEANRTAMQQILADPTLTAEQKEGMINQILASETEMWKEPTPWLSTVVTVVVIGVGGYVAYKVVKHVTEKKKAG